MGLSTKLLLKRIHNRKQIGVIKKVSRHIVTPFFFLWGDLSDLLDNGLFAFAVNKRQNVTVIITASSFLG